MLLLDACRLVQFLYDRAEIGYLNRIDISITIDNIFRDLDELFFQYSLNIYGNLENLLRYQHLKEFWLRAISTILSEPDYYISSHRTLGITLCKFVYKFTIALENEQAILTNPQNGFT